MSTTKTTDQQPNDAAPEPTGTPTDPAPATGTPEPADDSTEDNGDGTDGDQEGDDPAAKLRAEAARHRVRAKDAEEALTTMTAERDQAVSQLLNLILDREGLTRKLWDAAQVELPRTDSGEIDLTGLTQAIEQTKAAYGITTQRPPRPNMQQGQAGGGVPPVGLATAFDYKARTR